MHLRKWEIIDGAFFLVAPKEGHRVEFEQVVENNKNSMNDSQSLTEGTMIETWVNESGGSNVNFNKTDNDYPISLVGIESTRKSRTTSFSNRWIPEGERYFLIKCTQFPLDHRHRHHPSNGFLALQVDIQWPYKVPDFSQGDEGYRRVSHRYRTHFKFPMAISR